MSKEIAQYEKEAVGNDFGCYSVSEHSDDKRRTEPEQKKRAHDAGHGLALEKRAINRRLPLLQFNLQKHKTFPLSRCLFLLPL